MADFVSAPLTHVRRLQAVHQSDNPEWILNRQGDSKAPVEILFFQTLKQVGPVTKDFKLTSIAVVKKEG
ncbi:hypothetical protein [Sinorhizobium chiapasense]|uniref:Uncharacterized protein n=1 Tax=Sinorhizobium chiapasense TaxID=501572 RepID=A0ABZ2BL94_9HYPH